MEKILISAGEESGDLYASFLAKEIKKQKKDIKIIGFGGVHLKKAGADLKINLLRIAIIGFWEVVLNLFSIISVMSKAIKIIKQEKPDALVVIDFPGFHLWLIKKAKKLGVKKIIYWITPQVWAWKYERIKEIKKYCDLCIVAFPFEREIFKRENIPVKYFGHPINEIIKTGKKTGGGKKIGIFPGSRKNEIISFLPVILKACELLHDKLPETEFLIFKPETIEQKIIKDLIERYSNLKIKIVDGHDFKARRSLSAAIVKSGTVTLENALLNIPMVVVYKLSFISYLITKSLVTLKFISLPNIIAGKQVVAELIQGNFTPDKICDEMLKILKNKKHTMFVMQEYLKIRKNILLKNTLKNTAKAILMEI